MLSEIDSEEILIFKNVKIFQVCPFRVFNDCFLGNFKLILLDGAIVALSSNLHLVFILLCRFYY